MYIVIEIFDSLYPMIVTEKESGMPLIFESIEDAQSDADQCQNGIIVKI